jgi:hypothetical protein
VAWHDAPQSGLARSGSAASAAWDRPHLDCHHGAAPPPLVHLSPVCPSVCVCVCKCKRVCVCVCMGVHVHVCLWVLALVCVCVCECVYARASACLRAHDLASGPCLHAFTPSARADQGSRWPPPLAHTHHRRAPAACLAVSALAQHRQQLHLFLLTAGRWPRAHEVPSERPRQAAKIRAPSGGRGVQCGGGGVHCSAYEPGGVEEGGVRRGVWGDRGCCDGAEGLVRSARRAEAAAPTPRRWARRQGPPG